MKILHVIDSLGIGGAEILLKETLLLLPEYEHVVCYLREPHDLREGLSSTSIYFLKYTSKLSLLRTVGRLRGIVFREKPDIIHSHLFLSTIVSRIAILFTNVKLATTIHGQLGEDPFNKKTALYAEKFTVSSSHRIIGVSQTVLANYQMHINFTGQTNVLYNFVNTTFFKNFKINNSFSLPLQIVAIGNLKSQKNYLYLLKASALLKASPLAIEIYGEGPEREKLQRFIDDKNLPVILKGKIQNVLGVLRKSHLYVICSLFEGCPLAPLEAMAAGMPVLAPDLPVFREVLGDGAQYFDLTTPEDLANQVKKILNGEIDIKQLAKRGHARALEMATQEKYIFRLKEIYAEILDTN